MVILSASHDDDDDDDDDDDNDDEINKNMCMHDCSSCKLDSGMSDRTSDWYSKRAAPAFSRSFLSSPLWIGGCA